jgi:flagellar assembly protein FliH
LKSENRETRMKSLLEPVRFRQPLREVRVVSLAPDPEKAPDNSLEREEAAFERGRCEGEKALSEQLVRQRSELLALQQGVLQSMRDLLPQLAREYENTLVELALQAAQKLVAGIPIAVEMVEAAVREALARVEANSELTVLLNEEDLGLLQRANSPMLLSDAGGTRLRLQAGREITRGGCVVQTRFGMIDGRRETKLELLRKAVEA